MLSILIIIIGTPKKPVEEMLKKGLDVFLEIEVQGGLQMMDKRPDALSILLCHHH